MIQIRFVIMWASKILMWSVIASLVWLVFSCEEFCEESNRTAVVINFYSSETNALTPVTVGIRGIENDSTLYPEVTFINSSGLLTVASDEAATTLTVTAISVFDGTKIGTSTVTLTAALVTPVVTSVVVSPSVADVREGNKQQFTVAVETRGGATANVTWSVSGNEHPATFINSSGLLTVATGETAVTLTVMANSVFDDAITGTATVTVVPVTPTVISAVVSPNVVILQQGNAQQFTVAVETQGDAPANVIWSVSGNEHPATFINSSGLLTVATGETAATLTVTATSEFDDTVTGTATVTVSDEPVTPAVISVVVSPGSTTVQQGNAQQFTATVETHGGVSANVTWSVSGNMHSATSINSSGLLTIDAGETAATLTVTATSEFDNTITDIAAVTVSTASATPAVISVTISPKTATVQKGNTLQFTATVETQGDAPANVIWKVSGNIIPAAHSQVLIPVNPNTDFMSFTIYNANDTLPADIITIRYVKHIGFISSECGCAAFAEIQDELQATKHSIKDIIVTNRKVSTVSYRQGVINAENIRIYY